MKRMYPHLCSPIRLGNVTFRNRIFSAPMGATDIATDCSVGPRTPGFYELRAKGGAAAVTASELAVHPKTDASHSLHLDLSVPGCLGSHTFLADAIKRHGAVASIELNHCGQYAGTYLVDKEKKASLCQYGPIDWVRPDGIPVKALTEEQIAEIVKSFGEAAGLCKRAGYGMVMVHAGHGWLLNQFLSPYYNRRTDRYGGSLENRLRIVREVLESVRAAVGPGFPIELRISGSELFEGGYDIQEGCRIAQGLEDLVDLMHVSAGTYQIGFFVTTPPMFAEHGCNVHLAAEVKKHVKVPVATVGALNDPDKMEEIIASGKADVVEMARGLLADPEFPNKVMANHPEEIVHCLRCYTCMAERPTTETRRCAVNPLVGREMEGLDLVPALVRKRVLVAGGGVGGMEAALTAARRGHQVTLCEKTGELGGILREEQAIPFKRAMYQLGVTLETLLKKHGVDIRLNTEATPELVEREAPDALIVAVGSSPIVPKLAGMEGRNVVVVNDYYLRGNQLTDDVVVLGGGLAGCECAIHLGQLGKRVYLVEMRDELAVDCNIRQKPILLEYTHRFATVHTGLQGESLTDEGLVCRNVKGETELVPGTSFILAVGQRSNTAAADALRDSAPFVRVVGDCVQPANITQAIYQAYHAAKDI